MRDGDREEPEAGLIFGVKFGRFDNDRSEP